MSSSTINKEFHYKQLSYEVLAVCFQVHKRLGVGLPEFAYNRALVIEFERRSIPVEFQKQFDIFYYGKRVGHFISDLVVDGKIILELKAEENGFRPGHESQLFTYLRVSKLKIGYLINFGTKSVQWKRLVT